MTETMIINPDLTAGEVVKRFATAGTIFAYALTFPGGTAVIVKGGAGNVSVKQEWRADLDAFVPPGPRLSDHVDYQTLEAPSSASAYFSTAPLWVAPSGSS